MPVETSYSSLRQNLAAYLERVVDDREIVIIRRRHAPDVALVSADELAGVMETAHLLRSRKNVQRLRQALREMGQGKGTTVTLESLKRSLGTRRRVHSSKDR
jgi:antitoxin YefM